MQVVHRQGGISGELNPPFPWEMHGWIFHKFTQVTPRQPIGEKNQWWARDFEERKIEFLPLRHDVVDLIALFNPFCHAHKIHNIWMPYTAVVKWVGRKDVEETKMQE